MAMLTLRKSRNFAFRVLVPLIAVLLVTLCTPYGTDGTFRCFALFGSYFMLEACPVGHVRRHRPELPCERLYHLRLPVTAFCPPAPSPVFSCCSQAVFWKRRRPNR